MLGALGGAGTDYFLWAIVSYVPATCSSKGKPVEEPIDHARPTPGLV